jgi:acetyltransferase-like isoleucine patch superfamily enzyme
MRYRLSTYVDMARKINMARKIKPNSLLHFLARVLPGGFMGFTVRPWLHRWRGVKIGHEAYIGDDVYIDEDFPETVEIQDGATIAPRCTLIGHTKGSGKLIIEKKAAIGAGCIISCVAGQTLRIGEGAVISAGSTVLSDVPPFTLCGPPRIKIYGTVTVPFREAQSVEHFWRGVRPFKPKIRAPLQYPESNGSEPA